MMTCRAWMSVLVLCAAAGIAGVAGEEGAGIAAPAPPPTIVDGEVVRSDDMSIPALIICFRECLEGCVIVAVLLNMLGKAGMPDLKKWVWIGVIVSMAATAILGTIAIVVWYAIRAAVPQSAKAAFEGVLAVIAFTILTLMALKFLRLRDIMFKWENKLFKKEGDEQEAVEEKASTCSCLQAVRDLMHIRHQQISKDESDVSPKMLMLLTFSAIFREGVETVIFLLPMSSQSTEAGLTKGALVGCAAGIAFGVFVLLVGKYLLINIEWFFRLTTLFILCIAAGLSNYAMIELEQIDLAGAKARNDPIILRPMYNIGCTWRHPQVDTNCFLDEAEGVGLVFRALLGYRGGPTMLQCVAYLVYWQVVLAIIVLRYKSGTLFSRASPKKIKVPRAVELEEGKLGEAPSQMVSAAGVNMAPAFVPMQHGAAGVAYASVAGTGTFMQAPTGVIQAVHMPPGQYA